ncbi:MULTISPECIES: hypothetical protein [unclassified Shinella]|uniref:hypothetical protein n=1 Tax=unclassified Shinella TaxID=2643062 RepID=UPI00225D15EC|nr:MULTISPECIES: hypothetical protein [unclassified Shinella]MCO5140864.1 hypothetical protein [Shinella sp.]MDC7256446.1 hypothetical protein [Shinella sp. YE25]CAI0339314.1 conserved hypothetical protein [Rhizobiaceae bacterium]CAK7257722.1 conserved protein of unknown function [Shinella sp. WSC3-e]
MSTTVGKMKIQIAGETKARLAAEQRASDAEARAEAAEKRERNLDGELRRLRSRVSELEALTASTGRAA